MQTDDLTKGSMATHFRTLAIPAALRVDAFLFPVYMMLFSINSLLQVLKKPIRTLWISIYRQGFGVAFFIWVFIRFLDFQVVGVWLE